MEKNYLVSRIIIDRARRATRNSHTLSSRLLSSERVVERANFTDTLGRYLPFDLAAIQLGDDPAMCTTFLSLSSRLYLRRGTFHLPLGIQCSLRKNYSSEIRAKFANSYYRATSSIRIDILHWRLVCKTCTCCTFYTVHTTRIIAFGLPQRARFACYDACNTRAST